MHHKGFWEVLIVPKHLVDHVNRGSLSISTLFNAFPTPGPQEKKKIGMKFHIGQNNSCDWFSTFLRNPFTLPLILYLLLAASSLLCVEMGASGESSVCSCFKQCSVEGKTVEGRSRSWSFLCYLVSCVLPKAFIPLSLSYPFCKMRIILLESEAHGS